MIFALTFATSFESQSQTALYARGGYSWFTGVVGGELQMGNIGFGGGWMPNKSPLTGQTTNAIGLCATYYTAPADYSSYYLSLGYILDGYQYEDSYGTYYSDDMFAMMVGAKYAAAPFDLKGGVGLGWYDGNTVFTFEITIGLNVLGF